MTAEDFCRWLQGYCELQNNNTPPNEAQWILIKEHLQLVYTKVTPELTDLAQLTQLPDKVKEVLDSPDNMHVSTESAEEIYCAAEEAIKEQLKEGMANMEEALKERWKKKSQRTKIKPSAGPFCSSTPSAFANLETLKICSSMDKVKSPTPTPAMGHGFAEDSPNCPKCDSPPSEHKVENYDMSWHDGDVVCTNCNTKVRNYDAG